MQQYAHNDNVDERCKKALHNVNEAIRTGSPHIIITQHGDKLVYAGVTMSDNTVLNSLNAIMDRHPSVRDAYYEMVKQKIMQELHAQTSEFVDRLRATMDGTCMCDVCANERKRKAN